MTDIRKAEADLKRLDEFCKFLRGEDTLQGEFFGGKPLDEVGAFWWRKYLPLIEQAAAELTALRAKVKAQGEALKPFAKAAECWAGIPGVIVTNDNVEIWQSPSLIRDCGITVGDLRRAAQEASDE